MKSRRKHIFVCLALLLGSGCESYKKTGWWTPDSFNYTVSRDRQTGELVDYFGLTFQLK